MCSAPAQIRTELLAGSHLESQEFRGLAPMLGVVYALEAARVINTDPGASGSVKSRSGATRKAFRQFPRQQVYVGGVTEADIDAAHDRQGEPCGRP